MRSVKIKNFRFRTWTVPVFLLILCIISFGVLIPWLGVYWDDWPTLWYLHLLGPSGFKDVFAIDRPMLGSIFTVITAMVGQSPAAWQVFSILTRWASCLALWGALLALWPKNIRQASWVVLLYAVYPSFMQQYISVTYSGTWIILTAFFLSLALMIWAVRRPKGAWLMIVVSWLLSAFAMFSSEYFFGLEFLRPVLLWLVLSEQNADTRQKMRQVALRWAPYLVIIAIFLYWRIFLLKTPRGQIQLFDQLAAHPLIAGFNLVKTILGDILDSTVIAWGQTLNFLNTLRMGWLLTIVYVLIVVVAAGATVVYLALLRTNSDANTTGLEPRQTKLWANQAIFLGLLALFLCGWPFWITDLPIRLKFPWDRFTLAMMPGASLLFVGLLERFIKKQLINVAILGIAVGLAVGAQFQIANQFRVDWNAQKAFFWQLVWRAPQIKPGTTLLTTDVPLKYFSDNSLTAPLNWTYAPTNASRQMPYLLYDIKVRLGFGLDGLEKGLAINQPYRATNFSGTTSQAIVLVAPSKGCLKLLDPVLDNGYPLKQPLISQALPLSDLGNIVSNPDQPALPPVNIFGPEPIHDWCYYYEKAELARQIKDWQQVSYLGEQVLQGVIKPTDPVELMPFIEGFAHIGNWDAAGQLSLQAYKSSSRLHSLLCSTWSRIEQTSTSDKQGKPVIEAIKKSLECATP
jgi:hypothetical protein